MLAPEQLPQSSYSNQSVHAAQSARGGARPVSSSAARETRINWLSEAAKLRADSKRVLCSEPKPSRTQTNLRKGQLQPIARANHLKCISQRGAGRQAGGKAYMGGGGVCQEPEIGCGMPPPQPTGDHRAAGVTVYDKGKERGKAKGKAREKENASSGRERGRRSLNFRGKLRGTSPGSSAAAEAVQQRSSRSKPHSVHEPRSNRANASQQASTGMPWFVGSRCAAGTPPPQKKQEGHFEVEKKEGPKR